MTLPSLSLVRGHQAAKTALQRLLASQSVGHAYLFEGPAGVGKSTLAMAFLTRLACLGPAVASGEPCGTCRSCVALQRGDHPDLQVLRRDGAFIKIEQVRDATSRLQFDPVLGACKAVLVEDAELLHEAAANALLKTLEEPPARTVFVLVSSQGQRLLQTIRSRCQVLRLAELSDDDLAAVLEAEGHNAGEARVAAGLAAGSLHAARRLCDPRRLALVAQVVSTVAALGELEVAPAVDRILEAWRQSKQAVDDDDDEPGPSSSASRGARVDFSADQFVETVGILRSAVRDAMLLSVGGDERLVVHRAELRALRALGQRVGGMRLAVVLDQLERAEDQLAYNTSGRNLLMGWLAEAQHTASIALRPGHA